jgi:DNA mismatch repair protein MutL
METSPSDGEGIALQTTGGTITGTNEAARRKGTTVSVAQLFYNVPARRKFLRSPRSEWRAITEAVNNIALTRPDVRFALSHDGKNVLSLPLFRGCAQGLAVSGVVATLEHCSTLTTLPAFFR